MKIKNPVTAALLCLSLVGLGLYAADTAASAPPAPTIAEVSAERDQLKKQVDELGSAIKILQQQRNTLAGQLLDTQAQLQMANDAIAASRQAPPAPANK